MSLLETMKNRKLKEVTTDEFKLELNMPKEYPPIKARRTEEGGVRDRFMATKAELPDEITVIRPFNVDAFAKSNENTIYVSADGCDCNCGCKDKPVATLAEALKRASGKGGAKIVLKNGEHKIKETLVIGAEHSGTQKSPLIIMAEEDGKAFVTAAYSIPTDAFEPVKDESIYNRLNASARDNILVADLVALGITAYGVDGQYAPQLTVNGATQTVARYPNSDERIYIKKEDGVDDGKGTGTWEFKLNSDRPYTWKDRDNIWLRANFTVEYNHYHYKVDCINQEKGTIKGRFTSYGFNHIEAWDPTRYYIYNVLEELDEPGEWYLDKEHGKLYLYPPKGALDKADAVRLVVDGCDIINCDGAQNVIINGLDLNTIKGYAIKIKNSHQVLVQRCHLSGIDGDRNERGGFIAEGGSKCGIIASTIEYFSCEVMDCFGGNREKMIPANLFVQNCMFINPLTRYAMSSSGCGNLISHCYIQNTTIGDHGSNETIYEYNILEGCDTESMDSGSIYIGGGPPNSVCGNHYRYNYIFDFVKNDYGIYFDDMSRGMYAYGNIVVGNGVNPGREDKFGKWWPSGGRSFNHHNGGEHCYFNNISINAGYFAFGGDVSYWMGSWGHWKGWCDGMLEGSYSKRTPEYLGRNPIYKELCDALDQWGEDTKDPNYVEKSGWAERRIRSPWCNHYENNLILNADRPYKLDHGIETATGLDTNYITNEDPGFVDFEGRDYRFKADAEIFKHIPDFVPPPVEKMGLVDDFN